jgi:hypothetical protein
MAPGMCIVLSGNCLYRFSDIEISISSGEHAELPLGEYENLLVLYSVLGNKDFIVSKLEFDFKFLSK